MSLFQSLMLLLVIEPQPWLPQDSLCGAPDQETQRVLLAERWQKQPVRDIDVRLSFPLERRNTTPFEHNWTVYNYVDHQTAFPNQLRDYQNGIRTYDTAGGYNHAGTDYTLWPFWWHAMAAEDMAVIAAAPGVIVAKFDGEIDTNCSLTSTTQWNAVYIQHADGSVAIYGHLKKHSLLDRVVGESVERGAFLGLVGSSGISGAPHLHFELWDAAGNVIDPYAGPGNDAITESLWLEQPAYNLPQLNGLTTHSAEPVFGCYEEERPFFKTAFIQGDPVIVNATWRDPLAGQQTTVEIYDPQDRLWLRIPALAFDQDYPVLALYSWQLPDTSSMADGVYRVQATFEDQVVETFFSMGRLEAPQFAALSVTPEMVAAGEAVTLSWQTERAHQVQVNRNLGFGPVNGSKTFVATESASIGLTATGPGGEITAVVDVEVQPVRTYWVPHLTAPDGGFKSELRFKNEECCVIEVTIEMFSAVGEVLPALTVALQAGEELVLNEENRPENAAYVKLETHHQLSTTVSYSPQVGGSPALWRATENVGRQFQTRRGDSESVWDGLALVNVGEQAAQVWLVQTDAEGQDTRWQPQSLVALAPGSKALVVLNDGFSAATAGLVRLESDQPLVVTALRGSLAGCEPYVMWGSPIWPQD